MLSSMLALVATTMVVLSGLAARRSVTAGALRVPALVVTVLCLAIGYDNAAIALGRLLGAGEPLATINAGRFAAHALFTPFLAIVAWRLAIALVAAPYGRVLRSRAFGATLAALTAALVAWGVWTEILELELEARQYADTLRYVNVAAHGPPIPAIITIVVAIGIGVVVWRRAGWPWLFAGALAMFVAAALGANLFWLQNIGELILLASVVATLYRAGRAPGPDHDPAGTTATPAVA
jgi:hypothetical protein